MGNAPQWVHWKRAALETSGYVCGLINVDRQASVSNSLEGLISLVVIWPSETILLRIEKIFDRGRRDGDWTVIQVGLTD
jgi:hypothetical protein